MMIHLPLVIWPEGAGWWSRLPYSIKRLRNGLVARFKRMLLRMGRPARLMKFSCYEMDWIYHKLEGLGYADIEFTVISPRSNNHPHPFLLARKDGASQG